MEKKIYMGSNLKMYKTIQETLVYLKELSDYALQLRSRYKQLELFILPSYMSLPDAAGCTDQSIIRIGSQNMCWEDCGKYTGEISPVMLEEINVSLVMAGHSERRHIFGETDLQENKKIKAALAHDFTALLCIGETKEEKECGIGEEILQMQLKVGLHDIPEDKLSNIWVAYEPVWSIGEEGVPASPAYAQHMHKTIRETLKTLFPEKGAQVPTFYGGSVNLDNAAELIRQPDIDGLFVGRAAWDAKNFSILIETALSSMMK